MWELSKSQKISCFIKKMFPFTGFRWTPFKLYKNPSLLHTSQIRTVRRALDAALEKDEHEAPDRTGSMKSN